MTTKEKMNSTQKTARIVGVLFIIATVAGVLSAPVLLQPILTAPDYLVKFSENENKVIIGAILDCHCEERSDEAISTVAYN
jgi:type IV secretory pathway component VirB8